MTRMWPHTWNAAAARTGPRRRVWRASPKGIGIAALYARDAQALADRDELVVGVLGLARASQAVLLADTLIASAKAQAQADVDWQAERAQQEFRRVNGLGRTTACRRACAACTTR